MTGTECPACPLPRLPFYIAPTHWDEAYPQQLAARHGYVAQPLLLTAEKNTVSVRTAANGVATAAAHASGQACTALPKSPETHVLIYANGQLALHTIPPTAGRARSSRPAPGSREIAVDFSRLASSERLRCALQNPGGERLARACGFSRKHAPYKKKESVSTTAPHAGDTALPSAALRILDATAGLGTDSFLLASLGARVTALERDPLCAALLDDGLYRAAQYSATAACAARMTLQAGDARIFMSSSALQQHLPTAGLAEPALLRLATPSSYTAYDVVYLDPMFHTGPPRARARKALDALQHLLPPDADANTLLPLALSLAPRVVVKRPLHAAPLAQRIPHHQLSGRGVRFDVYGR